MQYRSYPAVLNGLHWIISGTILRSRIGMSFFAAAVAASRLSARKRSQRNLESLDSCGTGRNRPAPRDIFEIAGISVPDVPAMLPPTDCQRAGIEHRMSAGEDKLSTTNERL